jgi:hypothetical protein
MHGVTLDPAVQTLSFHSTCMWAQAHTTKNASWPSATPTFTHILTRFLSLTLTTFFSAPSPTLQPTSLPTLPKTQVAWWDSASCSWQRAGVHGVTLDPGAQTLSFHSTHLGPLAVVQRRVRQLPYSTWNCRPSGGRGGTSVAVALGVPGLQEPCEFEVGGLGAVWW